MTQPRRLYALGMSTLLLYSYRFWPGIIDLRPDNFSQAVDSNYRKFSDPFLLLKGWLTKQAAMRTISRPTSLSYLCNSNPSGLRTRL